MLSRLCGAKLRTRFFVNIEPKSHDCSASLRERSCRLRLGTATRERCECECSRNRKILGLSIRQYHSCPKSHDCSASLRERSCRLRLGTATGDVRVCECSRSEPVRWRQPSVVRLWGVVLYPESVNSSCVCALVFHRRTSILSLL